MIFLLLSILSSSLIFVIFKLFTKFNIDTLQAIVFNYVTAFSCGFLLYGSTYNSEANTNFTWVPWVIICGVLFISLFLIMGISSQKNGVAVTSVAVKMSLGMSMLLLVFFYHEPLTFYKITGIIAAVLGVLFMSISKNKNTEGPKPIIWMLLVLFIGSGFLDLSLNYAQNNFNSLVPPALFSAIGFGIAAIIGIGIVIFQIINKKSVFAFKNVIAGIVLGVPNYFSIFLLMQSYTSMKPWSDSTVLAITNVSVVLMSACFGFLFFKEKFTIKKGLGLALSIFAITLLYLANK